MPDSVISGKSLCIRIFVHFQVFLGKRPDPFVTAPDHYAMLRAGILQTMMCLGTHRAIES